MRLDRSRRHKNHHTNQLPGAHLVEEEDATSQDLHFAPVLVIRTRWKMIIGAYQVRAQIHILHEIFSPARTKPTAVANLITTITYLICRPRFRNCICRRDILVGTARIVCIFLPSYSISLGSCTKPRISILHIIRNSIIKTSNNIANIRA